MSNRNSELSSRLELALAAAREAGEVTLRYFQREDLAVELKPDASPVTAADREAEQMLRRRILAAFPRDALMGEEFSDHDGTSGYRWIVDPIDGTKSFVAGVPLYGTMVGVEHQGRAVVGVIHMPALDETVYAATGEGAWYVCHGAPPRQARVGCTARLADGLFCTTDVRSYAEHNRRAAYERLEAAARITRTWGDCYGYLLVATGRAALMVDPVMNVWDAAAVQPILEEAGGTFTDWRGDPTIHGGEGIATCGRLLDEVLAITRGFANL